MSGVVVVDHSIVTNTNASSLATPTTNLPSPTSAYTAHTTHALYSSSSASAKRASIVSLRLKKVSDHTNIPWQATFPSRKFHKNSNNIRTTKYTLLTFIPVFLFSQFSRFYNFYFLLGALTVFYGSSSLSPFSLVAPLIIVLAFSAVKEIIEDYSRYTSDRDANGAPVRLLRHGKKNRCSRKGCPTRRHHLPSQGRKAARRCCRYKYQLRRWYLFCRNR